MQHQVYFGSYTSAVNGRGITCASFDSDSGQLTLFESYAQTADPSYLCLSQDRRFLYAASEAASGDSAVAWFARAADGTLAFAGQVPAPGSAVCHVTTVGAMVIAASYGSGLVHRYHAGDSLELRQTLRLEGSGPVLDRQAGSHAHQTTLSPGGTHLLVCDLGSDSIWIYRRYRDDRLELAQKLSLPPGSGPRHIAWHPTGTCFFLACELSGAVFHCVWDATDGVGEVREHVLSESETDLQPWTAAIRIHTCGRLVACSNRRANTIVSFGFDGDALTKISVTPTGGTVPRDFDYDPSGRWILAAHQDDGRVTAIPVDQQTGLPVGDAAVVGELLGCVCVLFSRD